ncbi:hypothetical protein C8Q80DRAFT_1271190 [Daedaleopsis nitida]|nr:hypothetical protein C8Q80DRAFT_1271190 [Daedaleopsis nitida]
MRASAIVSSVFAVLATVLSTAAQAPAPSAPPGFETLFVGSFDVGPYATIEGGLGTRVRVTSNGGTFYNASTGSKVATAFATADYGRLSTTGTFFPDVIFPLQWTVDDKFAYLHATGVGSFVTYDLVYIHLETDSEKYKALNDRFLIGNISATSESSSSIVVTIFAAT